MSQESDVSSIDHYELPADQGLIEDKHGEAEAEGSAVNPETPEAAHPPASTSDQIPATTTTSSLSQTALNTATTTTTLSVATTTTNSNTHITVADVHQASKPEMEAKTAIPVPGLTDPSSEELADEQGSSVSPELFV